MHNCVVLNFLFGHVLFLVLDVENTYRTLKCAGLRSYVTRGRDLFPTSLRVLDVRMRHESPKHIFYWALVLTVDHARDASYDFNLKTGNHGLMHLNHKLHLIITAFFERVGMFVGFCELLIKLKTDWRLFFIPVYDSDLLELNQRNWFIVRHLKATYDFRLFLSMWSFSWTQCPSG